MQVFHACADHATTDATSAGLQRLQEALRKRCEREVEAEDFEDFEREVHALFVQAEREVLAEGLARFDVDRPHVLIDGQRCHRVLRSSETYTSAAGPVTVALGARRLSTVSEICG